MTEHVDVVIVGAGISGISAAWHLQDRCPDKSYVILERRENLGGTWDLFKYPGIRSDSDMFTLGFRFKPWTSEQGDRRRAVDPELPQGERPPRTASTSTSVSARRWSPPTGPTPTTGGRCASTADGEAVRDHLRRSCSPAAATTTTTRATRPSSPAATTSRARSSTRSTGRRISTTRARRSSSSAAAPPR